MWTVVGSSDEYVVARAEDLLVQLWLRAVPADGAALVAKSADELAANGPFSTLILVASDAQPPAARARNLLVGFAQKHQRSFRQCVFCAEGTGLRAAIMRSIMTGMSMMVPRVPLVVVSDLDVGCRALDGFCRVAPADLIAELARLRGPPSPSPRASPLRRPTSSS